MFAAPTSAPSATSVTSVTSAPSGSGPVVLRAALDDIRAERARRSLHEYVRQLWHVVEPSAPFVDGWYLAAICAHLEAVSRRELRDLLINMPPRMAKSLIISVFWPTWEWLDHPERRWLYSSYAMGLATRDSLKCRRLIQSNIYQRRWGDRYRLTGDQNAKTRFDTDKTGYRLATSVDGALTGEGGDTIVIDDPHNAREVPSEVIRESVLSWWDEAMSTRLNDPKTGARVIVMQRLHERDLAGHVLAQGGWEHLSLPMEYEEPGPSERKRVTALGWSDPRTVEGELLCPERFGPVEVARLKVPLGPYGTAAQLQQRPSPRGGGLFRRAWWGEYEELPTLVRVIQFVDSSFKVGVGNDPSVIATWGEDAYGNYYVIAVRRGKWEYPTLMTTIHDEFAAMRRRWALLSLTVEDKASGQSALQSLRQPMALAGGGVLPALPVLPFPLPGDPYEAAMAGLSKLARAEAATPLIAAGRVKLPKYADWKEAFIEEHERFPVGQHDDQVDTTSMATIRMAGRTWQGGAAVGGDRPQMEVR